MSAYGVPGPALTARRPTLEEFWRERVPWVVGVAVLALAALSPAAPPTAVGIAEPSSFAGAWLARPLGPVTLVEIGLLLAAAAVAAQGMRALSIGSLLDSSVLALVGLVGALHLLAASRDPAPLAYVPLDVERVLLLLAGYALVTRLALDPRRVRTALAVVAGALTASFAWLVLRYGLLGSTQFGTITGREALLITEDSLLVVLPLTLAWGALIDRRLRWPAAVAVLCAVPAVLMVEVLSLRRGALAFAILALVVRAAPALGRVRLRRRGLAVATAVLAVLFVLGVGLGPVRPLLDEARYAAESVTLQTEDASTSQRKAELESFERNVSAVSLTLGRGLGAAWNAEVPGPVDIAAFGGGETAFTRVGWHVWGLDWLYKLGLVGVVGLLALGALALRRLRASLSQHKSSREAGLAWSLVVVAPVLVLFAFTNPRVAFFAGVTLGLASRVADVAAGRLSDAASR